MVPTSCPTPARTVASLGLISLLLDLFGKATQTSGQTTVTGRITRQGKPVTGGTITFHCEDDGSAHTGSIEADGSYRVAGVVLGLAILTLSSDVEGQIPDHYAVWDPQYGLRVQIEAGSRSVAHNLDLPF
jgi:hypothetical protein